MMKHRSEIDGLRSVAVLPVILFHAGATLFSGGYVGVDIFFVISGYLITGIIAAELDHRTFSISKFYERRARRILPALFVVLAACLPFAWAWLLPGQFRDFAKSLVAVCLFASNIFFWRESGYFDIASAQKPLLHTWSLAVEEQYYVLFPPLLIALWRWGRRAAFIAVCVLAVLSFALSEWGWRHLPDANFYLAPTRAWELLVGSVCAFAQIDRSPRANDALAALGLLLIGIAIFGYGETTPFPSAYALVPTLGTALILVFATTGTRVARLLSHRVPVGIGLVSYSAYLWHQPLLAFARHYLMGPLPLTAGLTLAVASLGLAVLSYRYVETPLLNRAFLTRRQIFALSVAGLAGFIAFGAYGYLSDGAMARFTTTPERAVFARFVENGPPTLHYMRRERIFERWHEECDFYDINGFTNGSPQIRPIPSIAPACYRRDGRPAVFIWGDSHAMALRVGLSDTMPRDWQILQVTSSACVARVETKDDRSHYCHHSNWFATQAIRRARPEVVVVAQNLNHDLRAMAALRTFLRSTGVRRALFIGPTPHWNYDLPNIILRKLWRDTPRYTTIGLDTDMLGKDRTLKRGFAPDANAQYLSLMDMFCRPAGCLTYLGTDRMRGLTTVDYGHLSPPASDLVAHRLLVPRIVAPLPPAAIRP